MVGVNNSLGFNQNHWWAVCDPHAA